MDKKVQAVFNEFELKKNEMAVGRRLICVKPLEGYTTYLGIYKIEKYLPETKRFVITDDQDKECHVLADRFYTVEEFPVWLLRNELSLNEIMFFVNKAVHLIEERDKKFIVAVGDIHSPEAVNKLEQACTGKLSNLCICPAPKNDGSPFDGVSYHCPIHGR